MQVADLFWTETDAREGVVLYVGCFHHLDWSREIN